MRTLSLLLSVALVGCKGPDTSITVNDADPTVTIVSPQAGDTFDPNQPVSFCASIADNETDTEGLVYLLQSDKDGELATEANGFADCPSGNVSLSLTLSDQPHTLSLTVVDSGDHAVTATVALSPSVNTAPHCDIFEPLNNSVFYEGERVQFRAEVGDDETGAEQLTVEVKSNLDGVLWDSAADSNGEVLFDTATLTAGEQFLSMSVVDPRGLRDDCEVAITVDACTDDDEDGFTVCEGDCDDALDDVYPDAPELLDGHDNDCDSDIDEGTNVYDDDGDGFSETDGDCNDDDDEISPAATEIWYDGVDQDCDKADDNDQDGDGVKATGFGGNDCNDTDEDIFPGAIEVYYDGIDANCDAKSDNDADFDGFDATTKGGLDCDDTKATVNPDASEVWYDGIDQNCDAKNDNDQDGDSHADVAHGGDDCLDTNATAYPGAEEVWYDGVDQNCDAKNDYDQDGDGEKSSQYGGKDCNDLSAEVSPITEEIWYDGIDQDCDGHSDYDQDFDGENTTAGNKGLDCNDTNAAIKSTAVEIWYDGVDQNCDAKSDYDKDGDTHESADFDGDDCNDAVAAINPDAAEIWYDGTDQDCDALSDYDKDGDSYDSSQYSGTDCNDTIAAVNPGATEVWYDGVDQDCDAKNDYDQDGDGEATTAGNKGLDCNDTNAAIKSTAVEIWYDGVDQNCDAKNDYDQDGDGELTTAGGKGLDCNDTNPAIKSTAVEIWYDGVDQNCDTKDDYDQDGDGDKSVASGGGDCNDQSTAQSSLLTEIWYDGVDGNCDGKDDYDRDGDNQKSDQYSGTDCNDANASVYLGAADTWYDGVDSNCDGKNDFDKDADGYAQNGSGSNKDCNDDLAAIHPGATEIWYDGVDQNCDAKNDYDQDGDTFETTSHAGTDCDDTRFTINTTGKESVNIDGFAASDSYDNDCDGYCDEDYIKAGDLLITEIMPNPDYYQKVINANVEGDEWAEIYNTTSTDIAICKGWTLADNTGSITLATNIVIPARDYAVFGTSIDPVANNMPSGIFVEQAWGTTIQLANSSTGDSLKLSYKPPVDAIFVVDEVVFKPSTFSYDAGKSTQLKFKTPGAYYDAAANNDGVNWCAGTSNYGSVYSSTKYDLGTPGSANNCP